MAISFMLYRRLDKNTGLGSGVGWWPLELGLVASGACISPTSTGPVPYNCAAVFKTSEPGVCWRLLVARTC